MILNSSYTWKSRRRAIHGLNLKSNVMMNHGRWLNGIAGTILSKVPRNPSSPDIYTLASPLMGKANQDLGALAFRLTKIE